MTANIAAQIHTNLPIRVGDRLKRMQKGEQKTAAQTPGDVAFAPTAGGYPAEFYHSEGMQIT